MKRDPVELAEALEHTYATWNNPPSDGLPEGAGVLLEAAHALRDMAGAMEPFAEYNVGPHGIPGLTEIPDSHPILFNGMGKYFEVAVTVGDFRKAHAVLKGGKQDE